MGCVERPWASDIDEVSHLRRGSVQNCMIKNCPFPISTLVCLVLIAMAQEDRCGEEGKTRTWKFRCQEQNQANVANSLILSDTWSFPEYDLLVRKSKVNVITFDWRWREFNLGNQQSSYLRGTLIWWTCYGIEGLFQHIGLANECKGTSGASELWWCNPCRAAGVMGSR